ncbi:MAG TPA: hypothetical protein VFB23_02005 [Candidatus Acidoferrales bacterium]|jgi:hypothetical protein|nr:hypothetical protein [Candidatus Acidoferrales bacterium]
MSIAKVKKNKTRAVMTTGFIYNMLIQEDVLRDREKVPGKRVFSN